MTCRSLVLVFSLAHQILCAQTGKASIDLFQLDDEHLYWQCEFPAKGPSDSIDHMVEQMLKSSAITQDLARNSIGYHGDIKNYKIDCGKYGRSYFNTPKVYCEGTWEGKFIVEVKDEFYRVTVYGLIYERTVPSASNSREMERRRGNYRKLVTNRQGAEFKRSERDNLLLMSLSLRDQFDVTSRPKTGVEKAN